MFYERVNLSRSFYNVAVCLCLETVGEGGVQSLNPQIVDNISFPARDMLCSNSFP